MAEQTDILKNKNKVLSDAFYQSIWLYYYKNQTIKWAQVLSKSSRKRIPNHGVGNKFKKNLVKKEKNSPFKFYNRKDKHFWNSYHKLISKIMNKIDWLCVVSQGHLITVIKCYPSLLSHSNTC